MSATHTERWPSLCEDCAHLRVVRSHTGSRFLHCGLARTDARFAKYPPQPVRHCGGFQAQAPDRQQPD